MEKNDETIVQVVWHDARFFPSSRKKEEIPNLTMALFESVGYLVLRNEVATVIAAERNNEGEYRDVTLIPSGSIKEMRKLSPIPTV